MCRVVHLRPHRGLDRARCPVATRLAQEGMPNVDLRVAVRRAAAPGLLRRCLRRLSRPPDFLPQHAARCRGATTPGDGGGSPGIRAGAGRRSGADPIRARADGLGCGGARHNPGACPRSSSGACAGTSAGSGCPRACRTGADCRTISSADRASPDSNCRTGRSPAGPRTCSSSPSGGCAVRRRCICGRCGRHVRGRRGQGPGPAGTGRHTSSGDGNLRASDGQGAGISDARSRAGAGRCRDCQARCRPDCRTRRCICTSRGNCSRGRSTGRSSGSRARPHAHSRN